LAVALWAVQPDDWKLVSSALLGYGVSIASFLGAIHWGLAMRDGSSQAMQQLLWGVLPGLMGWAAMLRGGAAGLVLLATLLWICFAVDKALYPRHQLQAWLPMRLLLTLAASVSCLAAAVALSR
jgi:hypothetical protein